MSESDFSALNQVTGLALRKSRAGNRRQKKKAEITEMYRTLYFVTSFTVWSCSEGNRHIEDFPLWITPESLVFCDNILSKLINFGVNTNELVVLWKYLILIV